MSTGDQPWSEDRILQELSDHLKGLSDIDRAEWLFQSHYMMYQFLMRIQFDDGDVMRLGITFVDDEEEVDAFDSNFVSWGDIRRHGEVAHGLQERNGERLDRRSIREQEELCLRLRRLRLG